MTYEEMMAGISRKQELKKVEAESPTVKLPPLPNKTIRDVDYSVQTRNIYDYDRLDGKLKPKFDNYKGNYGNEDRLARQQGFVEKAWKGLAKFPAKVGLYATESVGTMTYGIANAIRERSWDGLWDNNLTKVTDSAVNSLNRNLAHYYTDEERTGSLKDRLISANFLFNDFADGLAFIGGAVLPSVLMAPLTGGASLTGSVASVGARLGAKSAIKSATKLARKQGMDLLRREALAVGREGMMKGAKLGKYVNNVGNVAKFLGQSVAFEAGMEARHSYYDNMDAFADQFEMVNGRLPNFNEIKEYSEIAEKASVGVFASNVALLSVTNAVMFGKLFGLNQMIPKSWSRAGNQVLGLSVARDATGKVVANQANGLQKTLGHIYHIGSKPVSEGIIEEGLQGVFGKVAEKYTNNKYFLGNDDFGNAVSESLKEQYGTTDGWYEVMIGALVGMVGGNVSTLGARAMGDKTAQFGVEGFGKLGYSAEVKALETDVELFNSSVEAFRNLNRAGNLTQEDVGDVQQDGRTNSIALFAETGQIGLEERVAIKDFFKASEKLDNYTTTKELYFSAVDNIEIPQEVKKEKALFTEQDVADYKANLKANFEKDYNQYEKATSFINDLDLTHLSEGDRLEIEDTFTLQYMIGSESNDRAKELASAIGERIGDKGVADALQFFDETLNPRIVQATNKYTKTSEQRDSIIDQIAKVQQDIAVAEQTEKGQLQKKYVVLTKKLREVENELEGLRVTTEDEIKATRSYFEYGDTRALSVEDIAKQLKGLENYIKGLEATGNLSEVANLKMLLNQYKGYQAVANEYDTTFQRMLDTNFFRGEEGSKILKTVLGDEYTTSEEFDNFIKENEELAVETFGDWVTQVSSVSTQLAQNDKLSQREKKKIEGVMRAKLASKAIRLTAQDLSQQMYEASENARVAVTDISLTEGITPTSAPIEGDTVDGSRISRPSEEDTKDNPQLLKDYIDEISRQVDILLQEGLTEDLQTIEDKQAELNELQQLLVELENGVVNQEAIERLGVQGEEVQETVEEIIEEPLPTTVEEVIESALEYGRNSEFGNPLYAEELQQELENLPKEEVEQIVDELIEEVENEVLEVEREEGDFERLRDIARQQAEGQNIATSENSQLMMLYPETFDQFLREENERIIENTRELRDGITDNENQENAETSTNEDGESVEEENRQVENIGATINRVRERIETVKREIEELRAPLDFTNSEDFKTFEKLHNKADRTEEENKVYQKSLDNLDSWANIAGSVIEGVSLTDLLAQYEVLKNAQPALEQETVEVSPEEIEETAREHNGNNNYDVAHNFTHAMSSKRKTGETEIAGITEEGFREIVGDEIADKIIVDEDKGTLIIPEDVLSEIIEQGEIMIVSDGVGSFNSTVRHRVEDMGGNVSYQPLKTDYDYSINENDVYAVEHGDELSFQVDTTNEYNQTLLDEAVGEMELAPKETEEQKEARIKSEIDQAVSLNKTIAKNAQDLAVIESQKEKIRAKKEEVSNIENNITELTEEDIADEIFDETVALQNKSETYKKLVNEVDKLSSKSKKSTEDTAKLRKLMPKLEKLEKDFERKATVKVNKRLEKKIHVKEAEAKIKKLTKEIESLEKKVEKGKEKRDRIALEKELIERRVRDKVAKEKPKVAKKLSDGTKQKLRDKLRVNVVHNGNPVNVLKGVRTNNNATETVAYRKFVALRDQLVDDVEALVVSYYTGAEIKTNTKVKAVKVFVGQPNFLYEDSENGRVRQPKVFNDSMVDKIVDLGYVENGKVVTRSGDKVNDDTFVDKRKQASVGMKGKTPIVVIQKGSKRIAYPVRAERLTPIVTTEALENIFKDENKTTTQRAIEINTALNEAGFNIKEQGQALIAFEGEKLNREVFDNILAQLENKEYLSSVENWTDQSISIRESLVGKASIDINLNEPFLSPKIKMDLSGIKDTSLKTNETKKKASRVEAVDIETVQDMLEAKKCNIV